MASSRKILSLILVLLIAGGGYLYWKKNIALSDIVASRVDLQKSLKVLRMEDQKGPPSLQQTAIAIIQLNSFHAPEGKKEALKRVADPQAEVRVAVAYALAYWAQDEELTQVFTSLINDSDVKVRTETLRALAKRPGPNRLNLFKAAEAKTDRTPEEQLWIAMGIYQNSDQLDQKSPALKKILEQTASTNPSLQLQAIEATLQISPQEPEARELFMKLFTDKKVSGEMVSGVYAYLVRSQPEVMRKRFKADSQSSDLIVKTAAIAMIPELCPDERWTAIDGVINNPKSNPNLSMVANLSSKRLGKDRKNDSCSVKAKSAHS